MADQITRVGLIGNVEKAACADVVRQAFELIRKSGREACTDKLTAGPTGLEMRVYEDSAALVDHVDLLLVFGGDGTILRVARQIAGCTTPMLGVNIGSLGFLTAVPSAGLPQALEQVWKGEFSFENRVLLQARGLSAGKPIEESALNDIVVSRGIASRLIELDVHVDGDLLTRYRCDGLIVSSPTGSTAYSLAAGGAVIFPTADVLAITPICPHTLSNRSLILPDSAIIDVKVVSPAPATILSADGQVVTELSEREEVRIRRSRRRVRLMHLSGTSFCETLRRKLHWRGATL